MDTDVNAVSSLVSVVCTAALCLLPLAAVVGGVVFFIKRKKKGNGEPAPAVLAQAMPADEPVAQPATMMTTATITIPPEPAVTPDTNTVPPEATATQAEMDSMRIGETPGSTMKVSPSELVVLRGESFAPAAGIVNSYQILGTEQKVEAPALTRAMFAAAFLALADAGAVQLTPGKRKATLGLREVDTLFVVPTDRADAIAWPAGSYEERILAKAKQAQAKQNHYVQQLVYQVLGEDDGVPFVHALHKANESLNVRGLLGTRKEKVLFSTYLHFTMLPETQAWLDGVDVSSVKAMLARWREGQPEFWKRLEKEINEGVKARTESSLDD